ncbi:MAG: cytochrome c biogenesis protein ResB [Deltaproteobacteria bacterium]|nr:cytochrome c biogenesis protein ResB [Deltaproteobacteria bacterium]
MTNLVPRFIKIPWQFFASTGLTIILSIAICIITAIGSIIVVRNQPFFQAVDGEVLFPWLLKNVATNLSVTLWMVVLIILITLVTINAIVCTTEKVYLIFKDKRPMRALFPHIVHLGFFIAILGHLTGSVFGFRSDGNIIFVGDTIDVPDTPGYSVRLDSSEVELSPWGEPSSIETKLTLFKKGREVKSDVVRINGPLIYRGIAFYHTNHGRNATALAIDIDGEKKEVAFNSTFEISSGESFTLGRIYPDFSRDVNGEPYSKTSEFNNPYQEIINTNNERAYLNLSIPGVTVKLGEKTITYDNLVVKKFAVLMINKDPGIILIIAGSAVLVIGLILLLFFRGSKGELIRNRTKEYEFS